MKDTLKTIALLVAFWLTVIIIAAAVVSSPKWLGWLIILVVLYPLIKD